jgi:hypothetical protein
MGQRNKFRLCVATYAKTNFQPYDCAVLIAPKLVTQTLNSTCAMILSERYFIRKRERPEYHDISRWEVNSDSPNDIMCDHRLLGLIVVGKVLSLDQVKEIILQTPVVQDDPGTDSTTDFNCQTWVMNALERVHGTDAVAGLMERVMIEKQAIRYSGDEQAIRRIKELDAGTQPLSRLQRVMDLVDGKEHIFH